MQNTTETQPTIFDYAKDFHKSRALSVAFRHTYDAHEFEVWYNINNINGKNSKQEFNQSQLILYYLLGGGTITQAECQKWFGCARLAARIYELIHKEDWDIKSVLIPVKNRRGKVVWVSRYNLALM